MSSTSNTNSQSTDKVYEYLDENGNIVEYDMNRLVFSETACEKIPSKDTTKPAMNYYRINIFDKLPNGKLQDFLISLPQLFTFGVSESSNDGEVNGYSLPLPMWNKDGALPHQKYITDLLENKILDAIKQHLVNSKKTFKQPGLQLSDLRGMKIFYRKKDEDGTENPEDHPTWYPKLMISKKEGIKNLTRFYKMDENGNSYIDEKNNPIFFKDPLTECKTRGYVKPVIKVESIYIGSKHFSVQMKVKEADFYPLEMVAYRVSKLNLSTAKVIRSDDNSALSALMAADTSHESSSKEETGEFEAPSSQESSPPPEQRKITRQIVIPPKKVPAQ